MAAAAARAWSNIGVMTALRAGLSSSIRSIAHPVSSAGVTSPRRTRSAWATASSAAVSVAGLVVDMASCSFRVLAGRAATRKARAAISRPRGGNSRPPVSSRDQARPAKRSSDVSTMQQTPPPATAEPGPGTQDMDAAVEAQMGKIVTELGAALGVLLTSLGTRSGLWAALAGAGPLTADDVAAKVSVDPSLVR